MGRQSGVTQPSPRAASSPGVTGSPAMAASQAEVVHQGVAYDLQVDTTHAEALACARAIACRLR